MMVNFRYKAKEADTMIRGLLFRADSWLETENRIPLNEAEELILEIETRVGDGFQMLEKVLMNEAKVVGHMIPSLGQKLKNIIEVEPDAVVETPIVEEATEPAEAATGSEETSEEETSDTEKAEPAAETA